jgi:hypothetical protein
MSRTATQLIRELADDALAASKIPGAPARVVAVELGYAAGLLGHVDAAAAVPLFDQGGHLTGEPLRWFAEGVRSADRTAAALLPRPQRARVAS